MIVGLLFSQTFLSKYMSIEQLIVQCLYEHRSVTLQSIGSFNMSSDAVLSPDGEKELVLPAGAISFEQNFRATADENLVDFITKHTRKMRPLASSDLDSYIILQKQLLNIGNPLIIPGLGTLQKNAQGSLVFTQGKSIGKHVDPVAELKEVSSEEVSFKTEGRSKSSGRSNVIVIAAILIVLLGGSAAYYFFKESKTNEQPELQDLAVTADTVAVTRDSIPAAVKSVPAKDAGDSSVFKVVIKSYNNLADAEKGKKRFETYGHNIAMLTVDSSNYLLSVPFYNAAQDTTKAKDSLRRIFSYDTYIVR